MPFNPVTGIYTPPAGATTATPGEIIASAVWNSIFTDLAAALTQVGQQQIVYNPRVIAAPGSFTVGVADRIILVEAPAGTITLPAASTKVNPVTIIGAASTIFSPNSSVLLPNGVETIDGLSSMTLTGIYGSITLLPLAGGSWLIYS